MPYSITHKAEEGFIEIRLTGKIKITELAEMAVKAVELAKSSSCHFILADVHEVEMDLSLTDFYYFSKTITETAARLNLPLSSIKRALVGREDQDELNFFETVLYNRGHHMALFYDMEEAKKWLFSNQ